MTQSGDRSKRSELKLKYGKDKNLEADANKWLAKNTVNGDRSAARDVEKMLYESGLKSADELRYYDPVANWKTQDSVHSISVDPFDIDWVESTICADSDDGNTRARNPAMLERQALMRHVEDSDGWGSSYEDDIPPLGDNGDRKICLRCGRSKHRSLFSPDARNRDGLHSFCKTCRKDITSQNRKKSI